MQHDVTAPTTETDLAETTTDGTGREQTGTIPFVTDDSDLGGESPCLAHLLEELSD